MKALRNYLDKIKPNFEEGGKFHAFRSVFDGFETFLFVPNATSKSGTHIHDSIHGWNRGCVNYPYLQVAANEIPYRKWYRDD